MPDDCDADGWAKLNELTWVTGKAGDVNFRTWTNGMTGHPIVAHRNACKRALMAIVDVLA